MLTYADKRLLASEFNTKFLPNHHPISMIFKPLVTNTLFDYETIRAILSCMAFNDAVIGFEDFYYTEMEYIMASKNLWTFANVNLTADDDAQIDKFVKSREKDTLGVLIELLAAGYKTSFAWIDAQNSFVVTVSGTDRASLNKGTSMTAWSDDLSDAIMVLGYKVFIKTDGGTWSDYEVVGGRR